jgi:hypothetical protein
MRSFGIGGALLAALCLACERPSDQPPNATPLPRFTARLDSNETRQVQEMNYDPRDEALLWAHPDTLLVAHIERYTSHDMVRRTCEGTGIYAVPVAGGTPRAIAIGAAACDAMTIGEDAAIDPAARWMVFSVRTEPNNSALVRFDLRSGTRDSLRTGCRVYAESPDWSPDGKRIAFRGVCGERAGADWTIHSVAADGSGLRSITRDTSYSAEWPSWSPDGRLVYTRTRTEQNGYESELVVSDTLGSGRRVLGTGRAPSWSPDGAWIAYLKDSASVGQATEIRVIRPDGTSDRAVYRNSERGTFRRGFGPIEQGILTGGRVWSPDGQWLAISRGFDSSTSVWRVNVATGEALQVTRREE